MSTTRLCQRMAAVQDPIIPVIGELIAAHPGTISLGQGVVNYSPPKEVQDGIANFFSDIQNHKYKPVNGIPELREAITQKLKSDNDIVHCLDGSIVVTAGANMGFINALLAISDPGNEIILLSPFYFNHEMAINMGNCTPVVVATDENYQPDITAIEKAITSRTRAVVTISPNNPSGVVYSKSDLTKINNLCRDKGIYHISDEAYEYFIFDGATHFSPGSLPGATGHTISLYSLSKAYGFASWRIGYMYLPKHLEHSVKKIQDTILVCAPVISQFAAAEALKVGASYCKKHLKKMAVVRTMVLEELKTVKDYCYIPKSTGAFFLLLKVDTELDSLSLVQSLVKEHGIATIPGETFGMKDGCYLRISFGALERDTVAEGVGRLTKGIKEICKG